MKSFFKYRAYYFLLFIQITVLQFYNLKAQTFDSNSSKYTIINLELDYITKNSNSALRDKNLNNNLKGSFDFLAYSEETWKKHFLTTSYKLNSDDFKLLFGDNQLEFYKSQLLDNNFIDINLIENSKVSLTTKKEYKASQSHKNIKHLIVLSNVVFTSNKEFALVQYYDGNTLLNSGNEILAIYKFNNGEWVLFKRITLALS